MKLVSVWVLAIIAVLTLSANADDSSEPVFDGPYVFYQDNKKQSLKASWVCNDKVNSQFIELEDKHLDIELCDLPATLYLSDFIPQIVEYNGDFNIVALSDMHGQYELSRKLLINNKVIDTNNRWLLGNDHLVITGDVFDRGEQVTEILWLLYDLEQQAESAGGKVHLLLGNHEVMILNGDERYLHPKYLKTKQLLKKNFAELFGKQSLLGAWLRTKNVLVKVNGYLFTHGGFHPELAEHQFTLNDINQLFKANLVKSELAKPRNGWGRYLHKSNGPIWYRGYFKDDGATASEIELLLAHFDVKKIVVGHTSQSQIKLQHKGKVVAIDSSLKKGKYGEVLFIDKISREKDVLYRGTLSGNKIKLHELDEEKHQNSELEGVLFE
jgi:hypothetical protein